MGSIADRIITSQDKDGMLRRALERIIQLYTDKSHFVYELLQNAEDAGATCIRFDQYDDRLEVLHDGKPFTSENLQGLCDIGKSDKVDNLNQIGEFGVGFKSVFSICEKVLLYSVPSNYQRGEIGDAVPFAVRISDFTKPEDIEEEFLDFPYTTKFIFPYAVGNSYSGYETIDFLRYSLAKKLQNLGVTTLLFMNHLEVIEYKINVKNNVTEGSYLLEKEEINDHCSYIQAIGTSAGGQSTDDAIDYLKYSRHINDKESGRTVDIAFPVKKDDNGNYTFQAPHSPYVSVYFPTETESKLNFIVQGPYRTTPNRSSIPANDRDNIKLAHITSALLKDTIIELRDSNQLNMSFLKLLPFSEEAFKNYDLFKPLYDVVLSIFSSEEILPRKIGGFVRARYARLARGEQLSKVLDDRRLSDLINDRHLYHWLPTTLTETNREYESIFRFYTSKLKIPVIRPEDLRNYINANPSFLQAQSNEWIASLYAVFENVERAFSKSSTEANLLTANIIKTTSGEFVPPYRKTEEKKYAHNVFLPTNNVVSTEIKIVDPDLYKRSRHFFDDILQLRKPDEYQFMIHDIKKRYSSNQKIDEALHIADLKFLLKHMKLEEHTDEVREIIHNNLKIRCNDGEFRRPYAIVIYLETSADNINHVAYFDHLNELVFFADENYYAKYHISKEQLGAFGVKETIITGDNTRGLYERIGRGRIPEWYTTGDFRWKLSIERIRLVLRWISFHPNDKEAILKSRIILNLLFLNETKLVGTLHITGNTPDIPEETCELIKILRGESVFGWNGKWLYDKNGNLVSQKTITKYDLNTDYYGAVKASSRVYSLLGFRPTEEDDIEELKKAVPQERLDAYFESELKRRFQISSSELAETMGQINRYKKPDTTEEIEELPFPSDHVRSWDALKKHAFEMFSYAAPVRYEQRLRSIRVSFNPSTARAYIKGMYQYAGTHQYACQMCHESCARPEQAQLFKKADFELDPMNLCLCPNCALDYRALKEQETVMAELKATILHKPQNEVSAGEYVPVAVADHELWFTQTHFAEIQELLKLTEAIEKNESEETAQQKDSNPINKVDLIGKHIRKKKANVEGLIKNVDENWCYIVVEKGPKAGRKIKLPIETVIDSSGGYEIFTVK